MADADDQKEEIAGQLSVASSLAGSSAQLDQYRHSQ